MAVLSVATRLAIKVQPPTVYLEYTTGDRESRRVRAVKLSKLPRSCNSSDLDKLTDKVLNGFPGTLDQKSLNRQQLQGLLAQLLLSTQQEQQKYQHLASSNPHQAAKTQQVRNHSVSSKPPSSKDAAQDARTVLVEVDATAQLESSAPGRTPDNKDGSSSSQRQQQLQQPAARADDIAHSHAADSHSGNQQPSNCCQPQQQQQALSTDSDRQKPDLLGELSDLEAELGTLGGDVVSSMKQQTAAESVTSIQDALQQQQQVVQLKPAAATPAAQRPSSPAVVAEDDTDGCLTLDADFLAAEDVDLNKATDYELRLAKAEMDRKFRENMLRPGQPGYVYDKQTDFQPTMESNEWDEED